MRDDGMYEIYIRKKIETGIKAADDGRVLSHDEVKRFYQFSKEVKAVMKKRRLIEHAVLADFERRRKASRTRMIIKVTRKGGIIGDR